MKYQQTLYSYTMKTYLFFFQEQPFYNYPGGSIFSSNRHEFSRRVYSMFFKQTLFSHRTDTKFPRNPWTLLEKYKKVAPEKKEQSPCLLLTNHHDVI